MQYAESFKKLGYDLVSPRQDWSAENSDGVCISIWREELDKHSLLPRLDLWTLHPDPAAATWRSKPGHEKRTRHLARALSEFDRRVDVVLVSGIPGQSYRDADPWLVAKRGGWWSISNFDVTNGYFVAEVKKAPKP